ncbi:MAG: helix-turn-helix transcriptional regulator [Thermoanaerobacteraceae bacterium]|nr:helix-turn-helix transcriptional regulator [Thermoanaerobacteraceae bacterium]
MRRNLVKLRKQRKLTQKEVAEELGISRAFYGMIEQNTRNPTLKLAKKIARYFEANIDEIFFD